MTKYQICTNCVMDTTDRNIIFDKDGVCDHCNNFNTNVKPIWDTKLNGPKKLKDIVKTIKKEEQNKDFNCLVGLSGGTDSSYMLHELVTKYHLKPLVFHVDGGWNSEEATHNINSMIDKLNLELFTEVINWEEMRDFQLSFFKSGLPHIDLPQDHAFVAVLYNFAEKYNLKYIFNGGNISTECVRNPLELFYYGTDMIHINDIISKFSKVKMDTYPFSSVLRHKFFLRYIKNIKVIKPLDLIPYIKDEAEIELKNEYGFKTFERKHFESRFTKFLESFWLPERFNFDVRRVQLSSKILTGQIKRDDALEILKDPPFRKDLIKKEFKYISTKLEIDEEELNSYLHMPKKYYWDYKNQLKLFSLGAKFLNYLGIEKIIKR